jgi:hypothetical protein
MSRLGNGLVADVSGLRDIGRRDQRCEVLGLPADFVLDRRQREYLTFLRLVLGRITEA